jgi:hypothetical protein
VKNAYKTLAGKRDVKRDHAGERYIKVNTAICFKEIECGMWIALGQSYSKTVTQPLVY